MTRLRLLIAALAAAAAAALGAQSAPAAAQSSCMSGYVRDAPEEQIRLYSICLGQALRSETRAAAHNNRGAAYMAIGDMDRALEDFSDAITYDDDWGQWYFNRAVIYTARGEHTLAEADLDYAVRLRPSSIRGAAYLMRADIRSLRGDRDGALADIAEATERARRSASANNSIAWFLATHPDPAYRNATEAVRLALRAVDLDEDSVDIRDTLAAAYAEAGMFEDAVREQSAVLQQAADEGADTSGFAERLALYRSGQAYHQPARPSP